MLTTERPKAITITVRDKKENISKSIVVYGATMEDVFKRIEKVISENKKST